MRRRCDRKGQVGDCHFAVAPWPQLRRQPMISFEMGHCSVSKCSFSGFLKKTNLPPGKAVLADLFVRLQNLSPVF